MYLLYNYYIPRLCKKAYYLPTDSQAQHIQIASIIFSQMAPKPPPQFLTPLNDIVIYPTTQAKNLKIFLNSYFSLGPILLLHNSLYIFLLSSLPLF